MLIRELPLDLLAKPQYWPDYHPSAWLPSPGVPKEGQDYPVNSFISGARHACASPAVGGTSSEVHGAFLPAPCWAGRTSSSGVRITPS